LFFLAPWIPTIWEVYSQPTARKVYTWSWLHDCCTTEIFGQKTFGALGYSQSYELAGAFPKHRMIAAVGRWLFKDLRLAFDYAHDEDYAKAAGGTGRSANAFTLRLTAEW